MRSVLLTAVFTGAFCSAFAVFIDYATDMLAQNQIIVVSFASGFMGSLIAQLVIGRWRAKQGSPGEMDQ